MKIIFAIFLAAGCSTTARVVRDQPDLKTIGVNAGRYGEALYQRDLKATALATCPKGYSIEYEGREPPTMAGILINERDYFWVVRCK
jgi:hypothetical protein